MYKKKMIKNNIKEKDVEQYLRFLKTLHAHTRRPRRISLSEMYRWFKVCNNSGKSLINMGVLQRVSRGTYFWTGELPSRAMVVDLLLSNRDYIEMTLKESRTGRKDIPPIFAQRLKTNLIEARRELDSLNSRIQAIENLLK